MITRATFLKALGLGAVFPKLVKAEAPTLEFVDNPEFTRKITAAVPGDDPWTLNHPDKRCNVFYATPDGAVPPVDRLRKGEIWIVIVRDRVVVDWPDEMVWGYVGNVQPDLMAKGPGEVDIIYLTRWPDVVRGTYTLGMS